MVTESHAIELLESAIARGAFFDEVSRKMNAPDLLDKAIQIATQAHQGQKDRCGQPYIMHPIRVMNRVNGVEEKMVAILHDVVEDTDWTFEQLRKEGFPEQILQALDCVTKREG